MRFCSIIGTFNGGWRAGLVVCIGFTLGMPLAALAQPVGGDGSSEAVPTPREIIDRLIAAPPVDGAPAVSPRPRSGEEGADPAAGGLDPAAVRVDPDAPLPRLRREGGFVVERPGRLIALPDREAGGATSGSEIWVFDFDREPGMDDLRPMIVQKTQRLQLMQDAEKSNLPRADPRGRGRVIGRYAVTGQVHTHRGVNYLLPSSVVMIHADLPMDEGDGQPATPTEDGEVAATSGGWGATVDDGFASAPAGAATFGTADDPAAVMEALLDRPEGATRTPRDPAAVAVAEGVGPDRGDGASVAQASRQEGEYLVQRVGRVIPRSSTSGDGVMFTFEADGVRAQEAPVVLMPSGLLQELEDAAGKANGPLTVALSGRVYAYRGVNHVLPTSYRTMPRRDNLGD